MGINNNKNYLSRMIVSFSMLLFAACLTMNVFFCSAYILREGLNEGFNTFSCHCFSFFLCELISIIA